MGFSGRITVLGAGAWGTTFASIIADAGHAVTIYARREELAAEINRGSNKRYVEKLSIPERVQATTDIFQAVSQAHVLVVALPSSAVSETLTSVAHCIRPDATIVSLVKGIDPITLTPMSSVIAAAARVPQARIVAVSGPNLADEIAAHQPTAAVVAADDIMRASLIASLCHTDYFRPYLSTDLIGCEIGGAIKNVIAIAVGAAAGLGMGTNTRSAIITRGLIEMARLGSSLGGEETTFLGLSGMGDLVATCSSELSRNFSFGRRLGAGESVTQALAASRGVVEGARAAPAVARLAQELQITLPFAQAVADVVTEKSSIASARDKLMSLPRMMDTVALRFV